MSSRSHVQAEIDTWGTILLVDAASTQVDEIALNTGIDEVKTYVKLIDELFSPFKETSEVSNKVGALLLLILFELSQHAHALFLVA